MKHITKPRVFLFALVVSIVVFGCTTSYNKLPSGEIKPLSQWDNADSVTTRFGSISGITKNNVYVWWGIPYAQPPLKDLRWKAPRETEPWGGTLKAVVKPPKAVQYALFPKKGITGSEDCLYLNIWRPVSEKKNLPVYVWVHGGGNTTGSSTFVSDYYGDLFAVNTDCVFVSINYRLGPFGWFTHPSLRENVPAADASGNYGLLDIQQALRWVQENIRAFGGDAGNVTVAGESAGAIDIISLLQSPLSEGLFQKAVIRSGGIMQSSVEEGDADSERVLQKLLKKDKLQPADVDAAAYLRTAGAKEIMRCYDPRNFGMISLPLLFNDGTVLPAEGDSVFSDGSYAMKVPILIGSNRDELKLFFSGKKELRKQKELYQAVTRLGSDKWKVDGVDSLVRKMSGSEHQPNIFVYYFTWGSLNEQNESVLPGRRGEILGACHALEVPFFHGTTRRSPFGIIFFTGKNRPGVKLLDNAITEYTKEFLWMSTDNPKSLSALSHGNNSLPEWTAWRSEPGAPKLLILDADYNELKLEMTDMEFSTDSIYKSLSSSYSSEIYDAAVKYVEENQLDLESLEKR